MLNLNSILIGSEDATRLTDFYTKVLGREPEWSSDGFYGWQAGSGYVVIGPHTEVTGKNAQPGRLIMNFETNDVAGEFDRIKGTGAEVVREPYQPGASPEMWLATFADPDGNYFQLATPMDM